jgi:hypothetical protein
MDLVDERRLRIVGGTMSRTLTLKVVVVVLPTGSVAVHVTSVVPTGKTVPARGEHPRFVPLFAESVASGDRNQTVAPNASTACAVIVPTVVVSMTGGVTSHPGVSHGGANEPTKRSGRSMDTGSALIRMARVEGIDASNLPPMSVSRPRSRSVMFVRRMVGICAPRKLLEGNTRRTSVVAGPGRTDRRRSR